MGIVAFLFIIVIAALYGYVQHRRNAENYDSGSLVIADAPDYVDQRGCVAGGDICGGSKIVLSGKPEPIPNPPVRQGARAAPERNANGTFAKGHRTLGTRGAGGRFVKASAAA